ncbi:MAG: YggT family protein [Chloroflexota bacterium]|nr:YggT family protein [Chloroflexota bacterium]
MVIVLLIIRIVDIVFGVFSVALLLRVLWPWFKASPQSPLLRFLTVLTEPLVRPVRRMLGGARRGGGIQHVDIAPLATIFFLWLAQSALTWGLQLVIFPPLWLLHPGAAPLRWVLGVTCLLIQLYILLLLARTILEWVQVSYAHPVMRFLWDITEPLLGPVRRRLPTFAGLDFSPLVVVLFLSVVQTLLSSF